MTMIELVKATTILKWIHCDTPQKIVKMYVLGCIIYHIIINIYICIYFLYHPSLTSHITPLIHYYKIITAYHTLTSSILRKIITAYHIIT